MYSLKYSCMMLCLLSLMSPHSTAVPHKHWVDLFPECEQWAKRGDCRPGGRPYFMQQNCPESCQKTVVRPPEVRRVPDDHEEFFDLEAKDASGKLISMENFEGYVTVIVNAARVCDYSKMFYDTLEHMHSIHPFALEILAFPFNHPNISTDSCADDIRAAEKEYGKNIHIMESVFINGPETHPILKYLKNLFGIDDMDPDFSHYFFVNPDGNVIELHYGASLNTLKSFVNQHVKEDLGTRKKWEL